MASVDGYELTGPPGAGAVLAGAAGRVHRPATRRHSLPPGSEPRAARVLRPPGDVGPPAATPAPVFAADWPAAEKWLLDKTGRTPADLAQAEAAVRGDADLARARAFVEQGMRDTAQRHLRLVRAHVGNDPLRLYWLTRTADALGQYTVSMGLAEGLARALDTPPGESPAPLQTLAFPTPYRDLVETAARRQGVDPALLWAIMRQESHFEPGATSTAGARGLTQVVPSTGQSIARALSDDDFTPADLYRPSVNIEFGAYYLAQQLRRFDGQLWAALAAYNAGPNAVPRWRAASDDWALQIEAIDYAETATYVRRVLEYWGYYAGLGSRE
ncbi:MAG: lytic transglycosylase domain-containing protein [Anaerolineae bacterium]|nr:lytic transglycosylase domain-containing protein [Anaerolineae bacterium]